MKQILLSLVIIGLLNSYGTIHENYAYATLNADTPPPPSPGTGGGGSGGGNGGGPKAVSELSKPEVLLLIKSEDILRGLESVSTIILTDRGPASPSGGSGGSGGGSGGGGKGK